MPPIKCRIFAKLDNKFVLSKDCVTNHFDFISFFLALCFPLCFPPGFFHYDTCLHVMSNALYNL